MLAFAYECGLDADKFFSLSFYEWSLEVYRYRKKKEADVERWESYAAIAREIMALLGNINRDRKRKPTPFEGKDFIKLSFDKKEDGTGLMTPEEVEKKWGKYVKK